MTTTHSRPQRRHVAASCGRVHSMWCARTVFIHCIMLLIAGANATAQDEEGTTDITERNVPYDPGFATVKVLARAAGDSVVLRWAPDTPHGWRLGNRIGYTVERRDAAGAATILTPAPVQAWLPLRLDPLLRAQPERTLLGVAALAAWGDSTLAGVADSLGFDTLAARAERNTMLYGYALFAADNDPAIAEMLGLRYVDRTVRRGTMYTYTVSLAARRDYRVESGTVRVTAGTDAPQGPPPGDLAADGYDGRVDLRWRPAPDARYTGYRVLRADARGSTFRRLSEAATVILRSADSDLPVPGQYTDSTVETGRTYRYRVFGIDAFGEAGTPAEVETRVHDRTPPPVPVMRLPEQIGGDRLRIAWEMEETPRDLAGFHVLRGRESDGVYTPITRAPLPAATRSYIDPSPDADAGFYIVRAFDAAGNMRESPSVYGIVYDTARPQPPTRLAGTIDTNGVVRLHWTPPRGAKLVGYRVLRANAPEHEFTMLTGEPCRDTMYVDTVTLRTLTRHVYYRVASVSRSYRPSEAGAMLELTRPDIVAPSAPVFRGPRVTADAVLLVWEPSTSDDIAEQVLYRSSARDTTWRVLARLAPSASAYSDTAVEKRLMYRYHIEAVDAAGLRARSDVPALGRPFDSGVRPPVRDLRAVYDSVARGVRLTWREPERVGESYSLLIFRADGPAPLSLLTRQRGGAGRYLDTELVGVDAYTYRVRVRTESGGESALSEPVTVGVEAGE